MPDDALLADVIAHPDDDAPRLVYADALEGRGDPRGELITVQCELARLGLDGERLFLEWVGDALADPAALDDGRIARLRRREAELYRRHGAEWRKDVRRHAADDHRVHFRRGFVEHVGWDSYKRLDDGVDRLVEAAPLLRCIDFGTGVRSGSLNALKAFFASPALARLRELYPAGAGDFGIRFLSESRTLDALERLCLVHDGGAHELGSLARASFFTRLRGLVLSGFALGAAELEQLVAGPRLAELQLIDCRLGPGGADSLARSASLADVRVLCARAARLGPGGALALARRGWTSLAALDLRNNKLGSDDAAALGASLPTVRVLDVSGNPFGDKGLNGLLEGGGLGELRVLSLQKTDLGDDAAAALAASPLLGQLRVLDLRKNRICGGGARVLASSPHLGRVRTLYIGGNRFTAGEKKALTSSSSLAKTRVHA